MAGNMIDKWDIISGTIGMLAWLRGGKPPQVIPSLDADSTRQKTVTAIGAAFGAVDEGIWLSLIAKLELSELDAITQLLTQLDRARERDSFRLSVVNGPVATIVVEEDVKDPSDPTGKKTKKVKKALKVGEFSDLDNRVIFLKHMALLVLDPAWGPTRVRDMLRVHQLATESVLARDATLIRDVLVDWIKLNVTLPNATNEVKKLTQRIPEKTDAEVHGGYWAWAFDRRPILTVFLAAAIVASIALFVIFPLK